MTTYSMTGLYEGEQLTLDFGTGSPVVPHDRNSINAKYVKGEVRIITEQARYPHAELAVDVLAGARSTPVRASLRTRSGDIREVLVAVQPGAGCALATVAVPGAAIS